MEKKKQREEELERKEEEKARKKEKCKFGKRKRSTASSQSQNDLPVAPLNQKLVHQKHLAVVAVKQNLQEDQGKLFRVLMMKLTLTGAVCTLGCMRMTLVQAENGYNASAQDGNMKSAQMMKMLLQSLANFAHCVERMFIH